MDKLRGLVDYDDDEDPGSRDELSKSTSDEEKVDCNDLRTSDQSNNHFSNYEDQKEPKKSENDDRLTVEVKIKDSNDRKLEDKRRGSQEHDKNDNVCKKHLIGVNDSKRTTRNDKETSSSKSRSSHKSSKRSRSKSHEDNRRRKDDYRKSYRSDDRYHHDKRKESSRDFSRSDRDRDRRSSKGDREYYEDSRGRYNRDSKSSSGRKIDYKDHSNDDRDNKSSRESRGSSRTHSSISSSKDIYAKKHGDHFREEASGANYDISAMSREENSIKSSSTLQIPSVDGNFVESSIYKERGFDIKNLTTSYPTPLITSSLPTPGLLLSPPTSSLISPPTEAATTSSNVPKYYKQATFNATKYAIQEEKKKLLWSSTKKNDSQSTKTPKVWHGLQFSGAQGQQMTEKFLKLMGSKTATTSDQADNEDSMVKYQENLFKDLDKQYSLARMSTHTHRGIGLGFSSYSGSK